MTNWYLRSRFWKNIIFSFFSIVQSQAPPRLRRKRQRVSNRRTYPHALHLLRGRTFHSSRIILLQHRIKDIQQKHPHLHPTWVESNNYILSLVDDIITAYSLTLSDNSDIISVKDIFTTLKINLNIIMLFRAWIRRRRWRQTSHPIHQDVSGRNFKTLLIP